CKRPTSRPGASVWSFGWTTHRNRALVAWSNSPRENDRFHLAWLQERARDSLDEAELTHRRGYPRSVVNGDCNPYVEVGCRPGKTVVVDGVSADNEILDISPVQQPQKLFEVWW